MMSFFGIPPLYSAGTYTILLTVRDPYFASVTDDFILRINSKPAVPTGGAYSDIDKVVFIPQGTYSIKLSNYFTDADILIGDTLTYSIK